MEETFAVIDAVEQTPTHDQRQLLERQHFPKDFGEDFLFGAGSAAYQHEGAATLENRGPSIWDNFCLNKPGKIKHGANGTMACDIYHNYKEDIQIMKKMGLNSFRMSISWTRIFPGGRQCYGVNKEGVKHYNDVINELVANGIKPFVTLFHWDFPQTLQDEYDGFLNPKVVDDFVEYAEFCFCEFGDRVKHWTTFNEPYVFSVMGYGLGVHAPGRGIMSAYATGDISYEEKVKEILAAYPVIPNKHTLHLDAPEVFHSNKNQTSEETPYPHEGDTSAEKEPYAVARHILLCHRAVVKMYWRNFKKRQDGKIGIVLNCDWMVPACETLDDDEAKERALDFMLGWFLEPLTWGHYPKRMDKVGVDRLPPPFPDEKPDEFHKYYDFIGINYYYTTHVTNKTISPNAPISCFNDVAIDYPTKVHGQVFGEGMNGRYVYPRGLYELLYHVKMKYDNPLVYVTENGLLNINHPEKTLREVRNDTERASYILQHLAWIKKARRDGSKVNGYFVWSMFDGFEWSSGYECRFGLISVDYSNYFARYPNLSAMVYGNFIGGSIYKLPPKWIEEGTEKKADSEPKTKKPKV